MNDIQLETIEQIRAFLVGTEAIAFSIVSTPEHYPYEQMMTPYEKLKSLPNAQTYLKAGFTFAHLDALAMQMSDKQAARQLNRARQQLFKHLNEQEAA
jgi:hypothetical protein